MVAQCTCRIQTNSASNTSTDQLYGRQYHRFADFREAQYVCVAAGWCRYRQNKYKRNANKIIYVQQKDTNSIETVQFTRTSCGK